MATTDSIHRFGEYYLDISLGRLFDPELTEVKLRPKVLEMLTYFIRNSERVVSKNELIEAIWPTVLVTENSLTQCISDLRKALGDSTNSIIRTVPKRGYILAEPPALVPDARVSGERVRLEPRHSGRPRIMITQFPVLMDDPRHVHLGKILSDDIGTELSRFSHFNVANLKEADLPLPEEWGVTLAPRLAFLVEGSIRGLADKIRINVRVSTLSDGSTIWSNHYEADAGVIAEVHDGIVLDIVGSIEGSVVSFGAETARHYAPQDLSVYDCLLRGREIFDQHREGEAVAHLRQAVEIDPGLSLAHGWLATALTQLFSIEGDAALLDEAEIAAETALHIDRNEPSAHSSCALAAIWRRNHDRAGRHLAKAAGLNPADGRIRCHRANWIRLLGRAEEALLEIDLAQALSPFSPLWFGVIRAFAYFDLERYDSAIQELQQLPRLSRLDLIYLAASLARLERYELADLAYSRIGRPVSFDLLSALCPYAVPSQLENLAESVSLASGCH